MLVDILIAIATLCNSNSLGPAETLKCQKYYIKCVNNGTIRQVGQQNIFRLETKLQQCILDKKRLGGDK